MITMNIDIDSFFKIGTPIIASIALIISILSYTWCKKSSMLSTDNNIIAYITATLTFLEKVNTLDPKQQELFKKLLRDAKFFGATTPEIARSLAFERWSVDRDLEEYFGSGGG
jgi:hypothetical protein